ncbi:hypothetical protein EYZ11_006227 [Aspergillus tanneri]|nr:hypothetical protein EYZ11_006227 [Aspergillus tanneri]
MVECLLQDDGYDKYDTEFILEHLKRLNLKSSLNAEWIADLDENTLAPNGLN